MQSKKEQTRENLMRDAGVTTAAAIAERNDKKTNLEKNKEVLLQYIRDNVIGSSSDTLIQTVYGEKPLVYADYTASGRSLRFIETYIQDQVMPLYANTHSFQSGTGKQTNHAREEARGIIKRVCNADEDDVCIFTGDGSTAAVNLLVHKLRVQEICEQVSKKQVEVEDGQDQNVKELQNQEEIEKMVKETNFCEKNRWNTYTCKLCQAMLAGLGAYEKHAQSEIHQHNLQNIKHNYRMYTEKPVVFLSVYEHNANLIPWRETGATIVLIPMTSKGDFDYDFLKIKLDQYKALNTLKIGAFSAGSNITGTIFDVDRISVMLHKAGFLACFDYAATCPYQDVNMNALTSHGQRTFAEISVEDAKLAYKDAMFISSHKLVGGPGSSGVLLAKKRILQSWRPQRLGGGIVFFVNELDHEFIADKQDREESGTPGIIQDIRAGLVFQLKEAVSCQTIVEKEEAINTKVKKALLGIENLILLGNNDLPKVSIFSFVIKSKKGKLLHPSFVCSLLNDLFGIQSRAGCQCSSMYGQKLLGIDLKFSRELKESLMNGNELLRIGYTRVNFNYFITDEEVEYILRAIEFISSFGWMFLPHYKFDIDLGTWVNRDEHEQKQRSWVGEIDYSQGSMSYLKSNDENLRGSFPFFVKNNVVQPLHDYLSQAEESLVHTVDQYKNVYGKSTVDQTLLIAEEYQGLIWFLFPSEVLPELLQFRHQNSLSFDSLASFNSSLKKQADELWTTPFMPRDYNKEKYKFEFSVEYQQTQTQAENESKSTDDENEKVTTTTTTLPELEEQRASEPRAAAEIVDDYGDYGEEELPFAFGDVEEVPEKPVKIRLVDVPKDIKAAVGSAIRDFEMIKEGDRVLIAISGGKDSVAMIHILKYFQSVSPVKFSLGGVTVDPQVNEYKPQPLIPYMKSLGIPYWIESDAIVERAKDCMQKNSICAFCSRMKRGMIYNCARREGYNVIAMGQHLDDLAESFVMSSFHNGVLRTMKANYTIDAGDLRVIRPLVTCREQLFRDFSTKNNFPIIPDNCPACFSAPKERHRIKLMLAQQEHLFPSLFSSVLKSITPLMRGNMKTDGTFIADPTAGNAGAGSDDEEWDGALGKQGAPGFKCPL